MRVAALFMYRSGRVADENVATLVSAGQADRYSDKAGVTPGSSAADGSDHPRPQERVVSFGASRKAAKQAFAMAWISPGDADLAEAHDCFSGVGMTTHRDLGACDGREAPRLLEKEESSLGGRTPVHPGGRLKSKGHPADVVGVAQRPGLVEQLREDPVNQFDGARWALAYDQGGSTAAPAITILEGSRA